MDNEVAFATLMDVCKGQASQTIVIIWSCGMVRRLEKPAVLLGL